MVKKISISTILVLYIILVIFVVFVRIPVSEYLSYWDYLKVHSNFVPFATISEYFRRLSAETINPDTVYRNLIGNVVLFIPLGMIFPYFVEKCRKLLPCLLYSAVTVAIVEVLQVLLRQGSCDIDDLILNVFGALIGFGIFSLFRKVLIKE